MELQKFIKSIEKEEKGSCLIFHTIDLPLSVEQSFDIIGNPENWPIINNPTAHKIDVIKKTDEFIEFYLEEFVGTKKYRSHLHFYRDKNNKTIRYHHEKPVFPFIKFMKMRWFFFEIDEGWSRFIIAREYGVRFPLIGKLIGLTIVKRIINSHVQDYQRELRDFTRHANLLRVYKQYQFI